MTVKVNNKEVHTNATTLSELASELALPEKGVAVAVSNKMIPRSEWQDTSLSEGVSIVVIRATCGG
ncbi:MAG TPA: thiamine biosynthesis protein ThiS [Rikenellaceae bacterium]|nr:thiamine biosynthesis protein ThiS [Rikenellaceae bacterium]HBH21121.1 thiamine biosynthesis protein ThiS [Rikenellaceae bacterium]HCZ22326.1 thiamine biosynthesis protein ThiS [Rikenellaceae bacterium]